MCWNAESSLASLVIGTIVNVLCVINLSKSTVDSTVPITVIIAWQYALLMQIPDALAWIRQEFKLSGIIAFWLNVTQPLVCFGLTYALLKHTNSPRAIFPVMLIGAAYIYNVFTNLKRVNTNIEPTQSCKNLQYRWWKDINAKLYGVFILSTLLVFPSREYAWLTAGLFVISLAIVIALTKKGCIPGSAWCISTASFGFITWVFARYFITLRESRHL